MIIVNQVICNICLDRPYSATRHDFKSCGCGNVAVDGGQEYTKRVFNSRSYEDISIFLYKEKLYDGFKILRDNVIDYDIIEKVLQSFIDNGVEFSVSEFPEPIIKLIVDTTIESKKSGRNTYGLILSIIRNIRDFGITITNDIESYYESPIFEIK